MATYLFDIDMTLLATGGAGVLAMGRAVRDLLGNTDGMAGVAYAGRTDRAIARELLARGGVDPDRLEGGFEVWLERFAAVYADHLGDTLHETAGRALPGTHALVERLAAAPGARVGLATGNFRRTGLMKLAHYGFGPPLDDGGFADTHEDRGQLVAHAAAIVGGPAALTRPAGVFVIGDTPLDVAAAHVNGFRAVAVATGDYDFDALAATGADVVFEDLVDGDRVLDWLLAASEPA